MKNLTDFCKTVETGVDLRLNCSQTACFPNLRFGNSL